MSVRGGGRKKGCWHVATECTLPKSHYDWTRQQRDVHFIWLASSWFTTKHKASVDGSYLMHIIIKSYFSIFFPQFSATTKPEPHYNVSRFTNQDMFLSSVGREVEVLILLGVFRSPCSVETNCSALTCWQQLKTQRGFLIQTENFSKIVWMGGTILKLCPWS